MARGDVLARWAIGISAAVLLAACGSDDDPPASASYGIETLARGVAKAVGDEEYVHLSMGDQRGRGEIQVDLSWVDPPQFRAITGDEPGEFLEFVRVDGRVYVGGEVTDNEWTWLPDDDPRALGEDDTFDAGAMAVLLALDVHGDYEAMVDAIAKVENKGEEEMSGVSSTHYLVTLDSTAWRGLLPEHSVHRQVEVEDELLVDLWIDAHSLPVRLEYDGTGSEDVRIDYSAWGRPVSIPTPPDAEPIGTETS